MPFGFWILPVVFFLSITARAHDEKEPLLIITAQAKTKQDRDKIVKQGIPIDGVASDFVTIFGTENDLKKIQKLGIKATVEADTSDSRAFPSGDAEFHDHAEVLSELGNLTKEFKGLVTPISIGKSLEGRDLAGIRVSSSPEMDSKPTIIFMGCHHAREHLSVEMPLKLARYLATEYGKNKRIKQLVDAVEIYIVPMINPDGAEYDIASGSYKYWRKNRRDNGNGTFGVDLNRNYGTGFGGAGSSASPSSDIYHGPSAFSEPETKAVEMFVKARKRTTVLLSFHTYSELILWPWGSKDEAISNDTDRKIFETMGKKMATWNGYTPQKSSELYLASGDTTDWAYDTQKIFAFTFELSPSSVFGGGFYPGAKAIEPTFEANLEPMLYLIENAPNPYAVAK